MALERLGQCNQMYKTMRISPLVLLVGLAGALGCGGGAAENNLSRFIGVWTAMSASYTETCDDGNDTSGTSAATLTIAAGTTSDLVIVPSSGDCSPKLNVEGSVATYEPSVCGVENTLAATFTLETDDRFADEYASEVWSYPTTTCQQMVQGTYQKN